MVFYFPFCALKGENMGQRSQMYVRIQNDKEGSEHLIARYFQWNYAERMISRLAHTLDWLKDNKYVEFYLNKIPKILETNFDYCDITDSMDILREEYNYPSTEIDFNDAIFNCQDNNDGQAYIDMHITKDGEVELKYALLQHQEDEIPITPETYLSNYATWYKDNPTGKETVEDFFECCMKSDEEKTFIPAIKESIALIHSSAAPMTKEELNEFKTHDYTKVKDMAYTNYYIQDLGKEERKFADLVLGILQREYADFPLPKFGELIQDIMKDYDIKEISEKNKKVTYYTNVSDFLKEHTELLDKYNLEEMKDYIELEER